MGIEALPPGRRLQIGAMNPAAGWETFDIAAGPHVDHVGDIRDLSRFPAGAFAVLYASHVLEHIGLGEAVAALQGWCRVLAPGGLLMVAVPDFATVCRLYLSVTDPKGRIKLLRVAYGGQLDEHDLHRAGYDAELLANVLHLAGFAEMRRVPSFGLFIDGSEEKLHGAPISLNMQARKPA